VNIKWIAGLALTATMAAVPAAASDYFFSSGGYAPPSGGGYSLYSDQWIAGGFYVPSETDIQSIGTYFSDIGSNQQGTLALYTESGLQSNTALFTTKYSATSNFTGISVDWTVGPGVYWAAFEVLPDDHMDTALSETVGTGAWAFNHQGNGWVFAGGGVYGVPALVVRGTTVAVPEPGTWALAIVGLGLAGTAVRRQRRLAARIP
jgi:hypothetical protein